MKIRCQTRHKYFHKKGLRSRPDPSCITSQEERSPSCEDIYNL